MIYTNVNDWCDALRRSPDQYHAIIADSTKRAVKVIKRNNVFNKVFKDSIFRGEVEGQVIIDTPIGLKTVVVMGGGQSSDTWAIRGNQYGSILMLREHKLNQDFREVLAFHLAFNGEDASIHTLLKRYRDFNYTKQFGKTINMQVIYTMRSMLATPPKLEDYETPEVVGVVTQNSNKEGYPPKPLRPKAVATPIKGNLGVSTSEEDTDSDDDDTEIGYDMVDIPTSRVAPSLSDIARIANQRSEG